LKPCEVDSAHLKKDIGKTANHMIYTVGSTSLIAICENDVQVKAILKIAVLKVINDEKTL
jgi:hypothetical protein